MPDVKSIPLDEAKFLPWLEPHMDQRMVPPKADDTKKPQSPKGTKAK